jgi:hypothetical protein
MILSININFLALLVSIVPRALGLRLTSSGAGVEEAHVVDLGSPQRNLTYAHAEHNAYENDLLNLLSRGAHTDRTAMSFGTSTELTEPKIFWVYSFGRSGSTSLQHVISEASIEERGASQAAEADEAAERNNKFIIFEPCHRNDIAHLNTCAEEMESLFNCDFSRIDKLYWWGKQHAQVHSGDELPYSASRAHEVCEESNFRVFKTIHMHELQEEVIPLLDRIPNLYAINVVRDVRGIYQSAKSLGMVDNALKSLDPEFVGLGGSLMQLNAEDVGSTYIRYMCRQFLSMRDITHTRLVTVRYEDLISSPDYATQMFGDLNIALDTHISTVVTNTYPGIDDSQKSMETINHLDSEWTDEEIAALTSQECQDSLAAWGYPTAIPQ